MLVMSVNQPPLQPSLKGRALRLLGQREHSRLELQRKLARFEVEPDSLAQVLDELQAKGFIDEQRALESVLHRRTGVWGAARIAQELHAKGLAPAAIREAVAGLSDTELARAQSVWQRKFAQVARNDTERARQVRFLLARGFAGDVVRRVVQQADSPDPDAAFDPSNVHEF